MSAQAKDAREVLELDGPDQLRNMIRNAEPVTVISEEPVDSEERKTPSANTAKTDKSPTSGGAVSPFGTSGSFDIEESEESESDEDREFPTSCLPETVADMVRDVAKVALIPESLAAVNCIGFLSASIGSGLLVDSGGGRITPANLFLLGIAKSGTGKGRAFSLCSEAFREVEQESIDQWAREDLPTIKAELRVTEKQLKKAENTAASETDSSACGQSIQEVVKLEKKRAELILELEKESGFSVADVTREKLALSLSTQPGEALASLSPEGRGVLDVLTGRYSGNNSSDEDIYLSAYSREMVNVSRMGRDPVALRNPCLSVLWLVQPDAARKLLDNEAMSESGMLPRFLIADTKAEAMDEPEIFSPPDSQVTARWENLIRDLLETFRAKGDCPRTIQSEDEAKTVCREFTNRAKARVRAKGDLQDVSAFPLRWGENAWRLALVLHAASHGRNAGNHQLSQATARDAVEIVRWFTNQQLTFLKAGRMERSRKRVRKLVQILGESDTEGVSLRDLSRSESFFPEEVESLANQYPKHFSIEKRTTGGRPSRVAVITK